MTFTDCAARKQLKCRKSKHERRNTMQGAKSHLLPFSTAASWLKQDHSSVSRKYCYAFLIPEVHSQLKSSRMSWASLLQDSVSDIYPFLWQ